MSWLPWKARKAWQKQDEPLEKCIAPSKSSLHCFWKSVVEFISYRKTNPLGFNLPLPLKYPNCFKSLLDD